MIENEKITVQTTVAVDLEMEAKDGSYGFDFEAVYTDVQPGIQFTYEFGGRRATVLFQTHNHQTEVSVAFDPETTENALELQRNGWQAILDNYRKHTESL